MEPITDLAAQAYNTAVSAGVNIALDQAQERGLAVVPTQIIWPIVVGVAVLVAGAVGVTYYVTKQRQGQQYV